MKSALGVSRRKLDQQVIGMASQKLLFELPISSLEFLPSSSKLVALGRIAWGSFRAELRKWLESLHSRSARVREHRQRHASPLKCARHH